VEWRISAYKGGWQKGARIYRDWHNTAMPPVPLTGARSWAAQIRTVVKIDYLSPYDATVLDQLAKEVIGKPRACACCANWGAFGEGV